MRETLRPAYATFAYACECGERFAALPDAFLADVDTEELPALRSAIQAGPLRDESGISITCASEDGSVPCPTCGRLHLDLSMVLN